MTVEQVRRLTELANKMRSIAVKTGSMHSFWDVIFDVEEFLKNGNPQLKMTAEEWIEYCEQCLAGRQETKRPILRLTF